MATNQKPEHKIVFDTAIAAGINPDTAKLLLAQMMHESANFTSNVYKANLNPMGMKLPSIRKDPYIAGPGTQPPGNEGKTPYARYTSLPNAVRSLLNWLSYNKIDPNKISGINDYAEKLRQRSYFGNTQSAKAIYVAGLTNNLKKIGPLAAGAVTTGVSALSELGDPIKKKSSL